MNNFFKENWFKIGILIIIGGIIVLGFIVSNRSIKSEEVAGILTETEQSKEVAPIYFYSTRWQEEFGVELLKGCPQAEGIDWDFAVIALSDYMQYGPGKENSEKMGPAEIQRHFFENCQRDMEIYNFAKKENPSLFDEEIE